MNAIAPPVQIPRRATPSFLLASTESSNHFFRDENLLPTVFALSQTLSKEPLTSLRALVAVSVHFTTVCSTSSV